MKKKALILLILFLTSMKISSMGWLESWKGQIAGAGDMFDEEGRMRVPEDTSSTQAIIDAHERKMAEMRKRPPSINAYTIQELNRMPQADKDNFIRAYNQFMKSGKKLDDLDEREKIAVINGMKLQTL